MKPLRLENLHNPHEFIEVPRWISNSTDYRYLDGKRVFVEWGGKGRSLVVGLCRVHGPNPDGYFAVDLTIRFPENDPSFKGYTFHLSLMQLERIMPTQNSQYDFEYRGVLNQDHPFTLESE
jgi:hypothetical protein